MAANELPAADAGDYAPYRKKSRFKLIMVIVALLLLLGGGGGAGYWWLYMRPEATGFAGLFGSDETSEEATDAHETEKPAEHADQKAESAEKPKSAASSAKPARISQKPVPLPLFTVNLADAPGNRYLKLAMEVEFSTPDAGDQVKAQIARVQDSVILLLSSKTVSELSTAEGKVRLKNEVASRLNQVLGSAKVVRIYFTDFVIQ